MVRARGALAGLALLAALSPARADLFGVDLSNGNLCRINETNAAITLVGHTGVTNLGGLDLGPDGFLYGYTGLTLYRIDPGTGAAAAVGPAGRVMFKGGLQFAPGGAVYAVNGNNATAAQLLSVDIATGAQEGVSFGGAVNFSPGPPQGMEASP